MHVILDIFKNKSMLTEITEDFILISKLQNKKTLSFPYCSIYRMFHYLLTPLPSPSYTEDISFICFLLGFRNTITESLLLLSFLRFFALFEKTIKDRSMKFYMRG